MEFQAAHSKGKRERAQVRTQDQIFDDVFGMWYLPHAKGNKERGQVGQMDSQNVGLDD